MVATTDCGTADEMEKSSDILNKARLVTGMHDCWGGQGGDKEGGAGRGEL